MQACAPPHKVLVAVDGSEQSLRAIRYAANVFPPDRTRILLFHVQAQLFELFSDLNAYPRYERRVSGLKRSATERKMDIANTMDSAVVYFKQKGFTESAIRARPRTGNWESRRTSSRSLTTATMPSSSDAPGGAGSKTGWSRAPP